MPEKLSWQSELTFGKYKGKTLLWALVSAKPYLKWCYEQNLLLDYHEIDWLFNNIKQSEKAEILRS